MRFYLKSRCGRSFSDLVGPLRFPWQATEFCSETGSKPEVSKISDNSYVLFWNCKFAVLELLAMEQIMIAWMDCNLQFITMSLLLKLNMT